MGGKSSSSTASETTNNDNRVVNDAGGGKIFGAGATTSEAGSVLTSVSGSGNNITDGRAFEIVDNLVRGLGQVATAQTNVARDIALMNTTQGVEYAKAATAAQVAALKAEAQTTAAQDRTAIAMAALNAEQGKSASQAALNESITQTLAGVSTKTVIALAVGAVVIGYMVLKK